MSISFTFVPHGFCLQRPNLAVLLKVRSARLSHTHPRKSWWLFSWQPFQHPASAGILLVRAFCCLVFPSGRQTLRPRRKSLAGNPRSGRKNLTRLLLCWYPFLNPLSALGYWWNGDITVCASGLGICTSVPYGTLLICKDLSRKEVMGTLVSMEGGWNTHPLASMRRLCSGLIYFLFFFKNIIFIILQIIN